MSNSDTIVRLLARSGATSVANLPSLGLSRTGLYRALEQLLDQGRIVRVRRGVYQLAEAHDAGDTWVQVMHRYPKGVLCLLSALAFHEITTQSPSAVWLALPKSAWRKPAGYPPGSNFVRFPTAPNNMGASMTTKFVINLMGETSAL